jgi:hypothetical protein
MDYWASDLASTASLSDTSVAASEVRHSRMLEAGIQANPKMDPPIEIFGGDENRIDSKPDPSLRSR